MSNVKVKGENFYRDAKKVGRLNMYKEGKPIRNKNGDILKAASFQSREIPTARIEPNRKWFGMYPSFFVILKPQSLLEKDNNDNNWETYTLIGCRQYKSYFAGRSYLFSRGNGPESE
jgi:hypothetical protein